MTRLKQAHYVETEVLTASPQRLRLMLIEVAIRSATRARDLWRAEDFDRATETMIHAQEVVAELLAAVRTDEQPELTARVAGIYSFIYRALVDAGLHRDDAKLSEALSVLEIERETWRQVCALGDLGAAPPPGRGPIPPMHAAPTPTSSFSVEA